MILNYFMYFSNIFPITSKLFNKLNKFSNKSATFLVQIKHTELIQITDELY